LATANKGGYTTLDEAEGEGGAALVGVVVGTTIEFEVLAEVDVVIVIEGVVAIVVLVALVEVPVGVVAVGVVVTLAVVKAVVSVADFSA